MAISSYRFVSPGVQVQEIDNSQLPAVSTLTGPTVIGRFEKGPTMRPVYITSFSQFVETFGNPIPGKSGDDVWRDGNYIGTTYAAYAAQAWLKNTPALNVVRLVGKQNSSPTAAGYAGWKTDNNFAAGNTGGGAYGLFIIPSASAASTVTGTLAAIWYIQSGSIQLTGNVASTTTPVQGANVLISSVANNAEFRAVLIGPSGTYTSNFNFDTDSDFYIRKVFNTNPILTNSDITSDSTIENYWLGESYERSLQELVNISTTTYGFIAPLGNATVKCNNFLMDSKESKTGFVIGQDLTSNTGSYVASAQQKLFRIATLDSGEYEQKNYKISISDVRAPLTDFDDYGTFTLSVRRATDSDNTPQFVERYVNVNLNPASPDYIAARIGDKFTTWDETNRRLVEYGTYNNLSNIIRVEMNDDVDAGNVDPTYLPFGFFGASRFNTFTVTSGSATAAPSTSPVSGGFGNTYSAGNFLFTAVNLTASIQFPSIPLRISSSAGGLGDPRNAYFGITVGESVSTTTFDTTYYDFTRALPADVAGAAYDSSGSFTSTSFVFSLDDLSASASGVGLDYKVGSRAAGTSYNGTSGYRTVINAGYNKFTMPLYGGFDGFDITEAEPLRNSLMSATSTEKNSSVYNTYSRAIDTCADPESLVTDIITVPGLTLAGLTNKLIETCENRADALAIIDLPNIYIPEQEAKATSRTSRYVGDVSNVALTLKNRGLNSSYAATYYPWVQIRDTLSNRSIFVPPSVVALGAMSYGQSSQELWFAPAGFTRGGLTEGRGGVPVINVSQKLSSKERDTLYENNINPIAQFPAEGIVIFGQKTLQVTPSALDRINVRRMMIFVKREISKIASRLLFDQNVQVTWSRFTGQVNPFLSTVKSRLGLTDYRVILDSTTTTPDLVDRNIMYAKIFLKPARSIEFIAIDFTITDSGASFAD